MTKRPLLALLLLPVACAQPEPPGDTAQLLQEVLAQHQASLVGINGQPLVTVAPAASAAPAAEPHAETRVAARPAGGRPSSAGQLLGQTPDALLRWLGEPRLRREEGPAEVWHYQATDCHLDLVLYRDDGPARTPRVAYAAARAVGTARRAEDACLNDIASGATRRTVSALTEQAEAR